MKARTWLLASVFVSLGTPVPAADSLSYDDPAMHFQAPDDWTRVALPPAQEGAGADDSATPVALFAWHPGKPEQRSIVIQIAPYDGTLDAYEHGKESDLHSGSDSAFVDKRVKTTLENGMPAYFVKVSEGNQIGKFLRRYDYYIVDGRRSIDVAYIGRQGEFDDKDVETALSSLRVTLYPRDRP